MNTSKLSTIERAMLNASHVARTQALMNRKKHVFPSGTFFTTDYGDHVITETSIPELSNAMMEIAIGSEIPVDGE